MALHEQSAGATSEWYTPAHVFEAMATRFRWDPCMARTTNRVPAEQWCDAGTTVNGLGQDWHGLVWLNPPFGARNGIVPWLEKFFEHGDGVALVPDRTSAPWWQTYAARADAILFVAPKLKFIGADGLPGRSPAQGTCLLAAGHRGVLALRNAAALGLILVPATGGG